MNSKYKNKVQDRLELVLHAKRGKKGRISILLMQFKQLNINELEQETIALFEQQIVKD